MASSYVNDLRLNEMATGDASGTWGETTNTNLELIAEAFSYGTEAITTNADTHTTTIADGATDPGRALYLKYTGTLDSACTITIGPNTVSKVWIIENGTSGSQDIILSQGSGANITIPAGDTKVVYSDGAGAGAAFVDAFASINVGALTAGTLTVGSGSVTDSSGAISFGNENLTTTGIVTAAGTSVFTNLDISGDIDVDGTTNLDVVDVDGAVNFAADVTFADGADIITASAGTSNFRAGVNAGNSIESGGNYNVVVGDEAGTAITTGDGNVAVGFNALAQEDEHGLNVAIGNSALYTQNAGADAYNTAVGYSAGFAVTTGVRNTIIGGLAGDALTTGQQNTALGFGALSSDTKGQTSVAIGKSALESQNFTSDTATYNTAVGYSVGAALTTGYQNTLIGGLAGDDITTGIRNVALGYLALTANTTAGYQTAVGYNSLATVNGGLENTALGANCLTLTSTGSYNVGIGANALYANTTASNNTAVGHSALEDNTEGSENTAVGKDALAANTTAASNVAVGFKSLLVNTTGSANTGLGESTLRANSTASNNTAVGFSALTANTTGTENVAVGYNAGDVTTTGYYNTIIGAGADAFGSNSIGNIVIGHNTKGVQAGDGGTDYIMTVGTGNGSDRVYNEFDTNASWTRVSDVRYKEEIQDNTDCGLDFINNLRPVTFKWKPKANIDSSLPDYDPLKTTRKHEQKMYGLIAQEVKQALDDNNITDFGGWNEIDNGINTISQEMFVHPLIKAVQELSAKCDSLQNEINILKGE
jgi:trimeric autotransporter adhesin